MIKSIYENSLDHLLRIENHLVTASREAPIFGLRNSSSAYKQMIKSIYENSLDHVLCVKNHSATASREVPIFNVYPDPVESPQDNLDFITNALAKMQLKTCRSHTLAELLNNP